MKNGESVNDYFARTLTIANKMRMYGEQVSDLSVIEKILRSMTLGMIMLCVLLKNLMIWIP